MFEAKVKEEQREEEKKKKIEQKMLQIDEKNDKVCDKCDDTYRKIIYVHPKVDRTRLLHLCHCLILGLFMQRNAEEKAKKKGALKRQEELDQKKKLEEEARRKKIQQAVRQLFIYLFISAQLGSHTQGLLFRGKSVNLVNCPQQ